MKGQKKIRIVLALAAFILLLSLTNITPISEVKATTSSTTPTTSETFTYAPNNWQGVYWFTNSPDVTPSIAGQWVTVNVSQYVPQGASGVILDVHNPSSNTLGQFDVKYPNSTDNFYGTTGDIDFGVHIDCVFVGINSSRCFKAEINQLTTTKFWLRGYTDSNVMYFTNVKNVSTSTYGQWVNTNVSSYVSSDANGVIIRFVSTSPVGNWSTFVMSVRKAGSSDNRMLSMWDGYGSIWATVGLNSSKFFQQFINSSLIQTYLVAYTKGNTFSWYTNAVQKHNTNTAVGWFPYSSGTGSNSTGIFVEFASYCTTDIRKAGSTDTRRGYIGHQLNIHIWASTGLNSSQYFEWNVQEWYIENYLYIYSYTKSVLQNHTVTLSYTPITISSVTVNGQSWSNYNRTSDQLQLNNLYQDSNITVTYVYLCPKKVASDVGSSSTTYYNIIGYPFQEKIICAANLWWIFYCDGSNIVYKTSLDAENWSSPTVIRPLTQAIYFSVAFNGTHFAYTASSNTVGAGIYLYLWYRLGTLNSNGTISWASSEQTIATFYSPSQTMGVWACYVSFASDGCPWIAYVNNTNNVNRPYVTKSSIKNGTWQTATSFPFQLSSVGALTWRDSILSLSSGKMYALYYYDNYRVRGRSWNGTTWGSEVNVTSTPAYASAMDYVVDGNTIHLSVLNGTTSGDSLLYVRYNGTSWIYEQVVVSAINSAGTLSENSSDTLTLMYRSQTTNLKYKTYKISANTWSSEKTFLAGEPISSSLTLVGVARRALGNLALVWATTSKIVRFAFYRFQLNLRTKDLNGNVMSVSTVCVNDGCWHNKTTANGWGNFTVFIEKTVSIKVEFQGSWVNGTFSVTMDTDKTIDLVCSVKVYSLTVYVQTSSDSPSPNLPVVGANLTLKRDGTVLNGLYGLEANPVTSSYNSTHARYVWPQLANQTASYTVIADMHGSYGPKYVTTTLTSNAEVEIELAFPFSGPETTKYTLKVTVVNSAGVPAVNVKVSVTKTQSSFVAYEVTDQNGVAQFSLAQGSYMVSVDSVAGSARYYLDLTKNTEVTLTLQPLSQPSGTHEIPSTPQEFIEKVVAPTMFVITSNWVAVFILMPFFLGTVVGYAYENPAWKYFLVGFIVLAFNFLAVYVLVPQLLFPVDLSWLQPLLWKPPTLELATYPLATQELLQLVVTSTLGISIIGAVIAVMMRE